MRLLQKRQGRRFGRRQSWVLYGLLCWDLTSLLNAGHFEYQSKPFAEKRLLHFLDARLPPEPSIQCVNLVEGLRNQSLWLSAVALPGRGSTFGLVVCNGRCGGEGVCSLIEMAIVRLWFEGLGSRLDALYFLILCILSTRPTMTIAQSPIARCWLERQIAAH